MEWEEKCVMAGKKMIIANFLMYMVFTVIFMVFYFHRFCVLKILYTEMEIAIARRSPRIGLMGD